MFSSSHHFVLCLFLLSFLAISSVNSEKSPINFVVIIKNETPNTVEARCYIYGNDSGDYSMKPGWTDQFYVPIIPGGNNTLSCDMKLGKKHGFFELFNLNDTHICHTTEVCFWKIHEDGPCMLFAGKCVLFKWSANSTRDTASKPVRYVAREPVTHVASESARYVASKPVRHVASESVTHVASEQTRYVAREPVTRVASESARYVASEPIRYVASEPVTRVASEPARYVASELTKYVASEPVTHVASEPVRYIASETVRYIANP